MGRRANLDTPTKKWFWKIIKRMGGAKAVAKGMYVNTDRIYAWVRNERVPEQYIESFVKLANKKEVDLTERKLIDFSLSLLSIYDLTDDNGEE
jgi:hypothetical protein